MVEASVIIRNSSTKPAWAYPSRPSDESLSKYFSQAAIEFAPSETDCFITNSKGDKQRLIFHEPQPLKPHEVEHLDNFRKYLRDNNLTIPSG